MKLFDLHCDTLLNAAISGASLVPKSNGLQISLEAAAKYEKYVQTLAVFSDPDNSNDEAYARFLECCGYLRADSLRYPDSFAYVIAVEGANLLNGDISRFDFLVSRGVKFLTLVWGGYTCIGGAHNDPEGRGLTDFGRQVAVKCFENGIIPDMSHCSDKLFWECAELSKKYGKPIIATHSNSRAICDHSRCLTDDMFRFLVKCGGICGISMVRGHLKKDGWKNPCGTDVIWSHIEHFLSLGGENSVALGTDLDGTSPLPDGIDGVGTLYVIADEMARRGCSDALINKVFYQNAADFADSNNIFPIERKK
ncbi:MAG: membrane dipeptidase [Eubacteriales bacterium]